MVAQEHVKPTDAFKLRTTCVSVDFLQRELRGDVLQHSATNGVADLPAGTSSGSDHPRDAFPALGLDPYQDQSRTPSAGG